MKICYVFSRHTRKVHLPYSVSPELLPDLLSRFLHEGGARPAPLQRFAKQPLLKVGPGDSGAGGGEEVIPQGHGEAGSGPTVRPNVGASIHRGQAVQIDEALSHQGTEPDEAGDDVNLVSNLKIILARLVEDVAD